MLKVGIVGLPNVGKSTLFNALMRKESALAANYPFATIDPNIGIIDVPDERLPILAKIVATEKIVPATVEFYDIAGLVRGASVGEGLGNKFLSHIRETSLICHLVRIFDDGDITHVDNSVDPVRDIQTIDTELILADLSTLDGQKEPRGNAPKEDFFRWETVQYVKQHLDKGTPIRNHGLSDDQIEALRPYNLLTIKPVIYIFNVSEDQLSRPEVIQAHIDHILSNITDSTVDYVYMCARLEQDIVALDEAEQHEYLSQFGLSGTGLDRLIKQAYKKLGLISFLTAGKLEARAWTVARGTFAPQAAGTIHTDFEKKFIKAEVAQYEDFVEHGGWAGVRAVGKATMCGKEYVMQDGDIVEFKVGA